MKIYNNPRIRFHAVKASDVISTSEIPLGDDVEEIPTEAPLRTRDEDWANY